MCWILPVCVCCVCSLQKTTWSWSCTLSACSVLDTTRVCLLCVQLAEDNMKLIVYTVSMENAGYYQCVAENTLGQVFAIAHLVVFAHSKYTHSQALHYCGGGGACVWERVSVYVHMSELVSACFACICVCTCICCVGICTSVCVCVEVRTVVTYKSSFTADRKIILCTYLPVLVTNSQRGRGWRQWLSRKFKTLLQDSFSWHPGTPTQHLSWKNCTGFPFQNVLSIKSLVCVLML